MNDDQEHSIRHEILSKSHHELLASAVEKGYFKIPRETTLTELADTHEISDVEASERLREGIDRVACEYLAQETKQEN